MLIKRQKPSSRKWLKRGAIAVFVLEGLGFVGSYFLWNSVNTEREYRKYLRDNYPAVLEYYYKIGETLDSDSKIRQIDYAYWDSQKN